MIHGVLKFLNLKMVKEGINVIGHNYGSRSRAERDNTPHRNITARYRQEPDSGRRYTYGPIRYAPECMVRNSKNVSEDRYRENYGRYYEDFEVDDIYEHRPARTVTQTDNIWFTLLTMNTHPLHFNDEYGRETEFDACLVNSALTLSIVTGMSVSDVSHKTIANLGWDNIRLTNPVFVGDTIYAESEVINKRESESRPDDGIVTVETRGYKQTGDKIMEFERSMLIPIQEKTEQIEERFDRNREYDDD